MVEIRNSDPMGIETALSHVEGKCAAVIRAVTTARKIPTGDDFDALLNFVAISAVRVPSWRATLSASNDRLMKDFGRLSFCGPAGAKRLRKALESNGRTLTDIDVRKLQSFIASDDYKVDLDRNWHIRMMLDSINVLLPLLAKRNWSLWMADKDSPDLVCSDRPVALTSRQPLPGGLSPSFGTPDTLLTIPLNRRLVLASAFEEIPDGYVMDRHDIAFVNTLTGLFANQIYSAQGNWVWTAKEGHFAGVSEYLAALQPA